MDKCYYDTCDTEQYFPVVRFYAAHGGFNVRVIVQMKATQQYFPVICCAVNYTVQGGSNFGVYG